MTPRLPRRSSVVLTCAFLAAGTLSLPVATAAASPPNSGAGTGFAQTALGGAVRGVVRSLDGAGLAGICVTAGARVAGHSVVRSAVSGADGQYVIGGLLPGRYSVHYQACGQAGRYASQWYGGAVVARHATLVRVGARQPLALAPVTLRPATQAGLIAASRAAQRRSERPGAAKKPVISGVVTNTKGTRLSGICVTATTVNAHGPVVSESVAFTVTRKGLYSFGGGLGTGRATVQFVTGCGSKANFAPQWWRFAAKGSKAKFLEIPKGSHFTGIDAKLGPGAALSGVVKGGSTSGAGVSGVCVEVTGTGPMASVFRFERTGAGGKYVVNGLGTGRYTVDFEPGCGNKGDFTNSSFPRDVAVTDGKTTRGINGVLPLAGKIAGTVTTGAGHTPVRGICVLAQSATSFDDFGGAAATRADGTYVLDGLPAGKYTVSFSGGCGSKGSFAPVSYDNQVSEFAATAVPVAAGQKVTGIDASMPRGGVITGTVTDTAGHPLGGICVEADPVSDLSAFSAPLLLSVAGGVENGTGGSNRLGRYRVSDLLPGAYQVSFSRGCGSSGLKVAPRWYSPQGGGSPAAVSVGTGTVSGIDVQMLAAGTITGVVTTPAGKPARGVCASAVSLSGQMPDDFGLSIVGGTRFPGETDKHGDYRIADLAAGRYQVEFTSCDGAAYALSWYKQAGSVASARAVTVRSGRTRSGIDQKMSFGSALSGKITKVGGGAPGTTICVLVSDSPGNSVSDLVALTVGGKSGAYTFGHLSPGTYSLQFFPCFARLSGLANVARPQVKVGAAPRKGVDVALPAQGFLAGTVSAGTPPVPLGGLCVLATPVTGDGVADLAFTGADGGYRIPGLAPGAYRVAFSSECPFSPGGLVKKTLASPVAVSSGATTSGVGATLRADGGISGTVQASGSPVAGVCVLAFPSASPRAAPVVAVTSAKGAYQLGDLTPRLYVVEFTAGCGAAKFRTRWFKGASSRSAATLVPVSAGTITSGING